METSQISRQDRILLIIVAMIVLWFLLVGLWMLVVSMLQNVSLLQSTVSRWVAIAGLVVFFAFLIGVRLLSKKRDVNTIQVENNEAVFTEGSLLDKKKTAVPLSNVVKIQYERTTEMMISTSVIAALKKYIHFHLNNGTKETVVVSFYEEPVITNFLNDIKQNHTAIQVIEDNSGIWNPQAVTPVTPA